MKNFIKRACYIVICFAMVTTTLIIPDVVKASGKMNYALNKTVTSSAQHASWPASKATDGVINRQAEKQEQSRWSAEARPAQWIRIDLGEERTFDQFKIAWEKAEQLPSKFKIEISSDDTTYTLAHQAPLKAAGYDLDTTINLGKPVSGRYVKLTVESLIANAWPSVSLYEFQVLGAMDIENYVLSSTLTANGHEDSNVLPSMAGDGLLSTRWASMRVINEKWLQAEFSEAKTVRSIVINWERKNATNYVIQTSMDAQTWNDVVEKTSAPTNYREVFNLLTDAQAKYVRVLIKNFIATGAPEGGNNVTWETVSILELEVYGEELELPSKSLSEIAATLEMNIQDNVLTMPAVPSGVTIDFIGADYEQIIDYDRNIHQPLTDTNVLVNFRLQRGQEVVESPDIRITVPGKNSGAGENAKPTVVPELAEWHGKSGNFTILNSSKIVVSTSLGDAYMKVAKEFASDYTSITGKSITVVQGDTPATGDFYFKTETLDKGLGEEGYIMDIQDAITISAVHERGAYWSTRSILQILKQNGTTIPKGITRDYPKYEVRGFMLDVGRKPFSMEYLDSLAKNMAWYKMNDLQLHLSDNFIWVENYTSAGKDARDECYSAFRMESDYVGPENGLALTATDQYYTKDEFRKYIKDARVMGVNIVPEFDTPAHSLAFTRVRPDLSMKDKTVRRWVDHLDLVDSYDESIGFVQDLFNEYMTGENPVFDELTTINVGTDEYEGAYKNQFQRYTAEMLDFVKGTGRKVRLWGSLGDSTAVGSNPKLNTENVQMLMWSNSWAKPREMYNEGFNMINMNDGAVYIVPGANYYGDYLNQQSLYQNYNANNFGGTLLPAGSPQVDGAEFAVWNDYVDMYSNGISEYEITKRVFPVITAMSERLWGDAQDKTYAQFKEVTNITKEAPGANMLYEVETADSSVVDYDFNNTDAPLKDTSGNDYDAVSTHKAEVKEADGKTLLELQGNDSYVETDLENLAPDFELTFKVKRLSDSTNEQILFESDKASIKAVQKETGKVGYSRDFYDYSFNYILPVGEWHELKIQSIGISTYLFVDGVKVDEILGTGKGNATHANIKNYPTLTMPLSRIGSKTAAFEGYIDDVLVSKEFASDKLKYEQSELSATATSFNNDGVAANALDGDPSTIWHSYYSAGTNGTWPHSLTVSFKDGETHEVGKLSYLPRSSGVNGNVTKYNLYATLGDNSEVKIVSEGIWAANGGLKSVTFTPVAAKAIRMEVINSAGDTQNQHASCAELNLYRPEVLTTDKDHLQKVIEDAKSITAEHYTANSFTLLSSKLLNAKTVDENTSASQTEITAAVNELQEAIQGLVDLRALKAAVASFEMLSQADYPSTAYEALKQIVTEAKVLYANGSQASVEEAILSIQVGRTTLELAALSQLIETCNAQHEENYTAENWDSYVLAKSAAEAILENSSEVKVEDIVTAKANLKTAYDALVLVEADKQALGTLLEEAKKLLESVYTSDSWFAFKEKLDAAQLVYEKDGATVYEVRLAEENLKVVMDALLQRGNIEELQTLVDQHIEGKYTPESWSIFAPTWNKTKDIIGKGDNATKQECEAVKVELEEAAKKLVKINISLQVVVDTIATYEALDKNMYTTSSYLILSDELIKAKAFVNTGSDDEVEIEQVLVALHSANQALVLRGDITALLQYVQSLQDLNEYDYTVESWNVLEEEIVKANVIISDNSDKNQAEVDAVLTNVKTAHISLVTRSETPEVNKEALVELLAASSNYTEVEYMRSSWNVFKAAYTNAIQVNSSNKVTQAEVDDAKTELTTAINSLVKRGDIQKLQKLVIAYEEENLLATNYTQASWDVYQTALTAAKSLVRDNSEVNQDMVDASYKSLLEAYSTLTISHNKESLDISIKQANEIKENAFTASSYNFMKEVLAQAKLIQQDEKALQSDIDKIQKNLQTAIQALVERGDIDALVNYFNKVSNLHAGSYSEASWMKFAQAVERASQVIDQQAEMTPIMIKECLEALEKAYSQLEIVHKNVEIVDRNTSVSIQAPAGVLDPSTVLSVKAILDNHELSNMVENALKDIAANYRAFDITLLLNDVAVQPNGKVKVRFLIPEGFDRTKLEVYYIDEYQKILMPIIIDGDYVEFETSHFSVYALVEKISTEQSNVPTVTPNTTPNTGDTTDAMPYMSMLIVAGGLLLLSYKKRVRQ